MIRFERLSRLARQRIPSTDVPGHLVVARPGLLAYPDGAQIILRNRSEDQHYLTFKGVGIEGIAEVVANTAGSIIAARTEFGGLYVWKIRDGTPDLKASGETPLPRSIHMMRFIDEQMLGLIGREGFYVYDLSKPDKPTVNPLQIWEVKFDYSLFELTSNYLFAADEGSTFVLALQRKTKTEEKISLPEQPRSLGTGGKDGQFLFVGGVEKVYVVPIDSLEVSHAIKLPSMTGSGSYPVRAITGVPGTDFVLASGPNQIHVAEVNSSKAFTDYDVNDYVWRMEVAASGREIYWQGNSEYGSLPLSDFTVGIPTEEELQLLTGKRLSNEEIVPVEAFQVKAVNSDTRRP